MKGLELSKKFYFAYGKPMLENQFSSVMPNLATGLIGSGSECFGYDDDISQDHDFEPGFMILLPDEEIIDRQTAFQLERAYSKLPKRFEGYQRNLLSPVGGARHGVIRISEFVLRKTGVKDGLLTDKQWMSTPETSLAEIVNGEIYYDGPGYLTEIRKRLSYYPERIRRKKLAGNLLLMAQSGQYNYTRCLSHNEQAAAQLAVFEFTRSTISTIFLLNQRYMPYYKWLFRSLRSLPVLSIEAELLEFLITTENEPSISEEKYKIIEGISSDIIDVLIDEGLSKANCSDLEKHAYSVNDSIDDPEIRNMHILSAI